MQFGNIEGLINGTEQIIFDSEVSGLAVPSISTGAILNGDEDGWYTIIARFIYDTADATAKMYFNADSTDGNYGYRGLSSNNTTVADINSTASTIKLASVATGSTSGFSVVRLYAKQGSARICNVLNVSNMNGTTVTQIETLGGVWNNTNTNITTSVFVPSSGNFGVGSRIIILKSNNFTGGTPTGDIKTPYIKKAWVRVGSQVLSATASTISFTGLDGDRDDVYHLSLKPKATGAGGADLNVTINGDGGNNYGTQVITAINTAINGYRATTASSLFLPYANTGGSGDEVDLNNLILFAKSGFVRPVVGTNASLISGTTISGIEVFGQVWNNTTATVGTITITPRASQFAIGSQFDLYALRPNG